MKRRVFIAYFLLLAVLISVSQYVGVSIGAGTVARLATIESLIERGTPVIDGSSLAATPDKVLIEGHFYGGQLPLLQYAVAPLYGALHWIFGLSLSNNLRLTYGIITLCTVGALSSLMIALFYQLMHRLWAPVSGALLATATLGLGTLVLPYSTVFNPHIIAGALIFFSLYLFFRNPGRPSAVMIGFLAGTAAVIDPAPGGAFCAALLLLLWAESSGRRWLLLFFAGALVPIAMHCIISRWTVGTVLPVNIYQSHYGYPGSIFDGTNLSGVASHDSLGSFLAYGYHALIGRRGLFSYNPVLLFPLATILSCALFKKRGGAGRAPSLVILLAAAAVVIAYLLKSVNYGGWAYGMRFFVPLIPPISIYLGPFLAVRHRPLVRVLFVLSLVVSVVISLIGAVNPWSDLYIGPNPIVNNITMAFGNLGVRPPSILTGTAMGINEGDGRSLYYLGKKFSLYGWKDLARDAFFRAVGADPRNSAARLSLANAHYGLGELAAAREEYGSLIVSDRDYIGAVHEYDIARGVNVIRIAPEDFAARRNMAFLLVSEGRAGEAGGLIRDYLEKSGARLRERYRGELGEGEVEIVYPRSLGSLELLLGRLEAGETEDLIDNHGEIKEQNKDELTIDD